MTEPITDKRLSLMRAMAKDDAGWRWGTADVQEMIARIDQAEERLARVNSFAGAAAVVGALRDSDPDSNAATTVQAALGVVATAEICLSGCNIYTPPEDYCQRCAVHGLGGREAPMDPCSECGKPSTMEAGARPGPMTAYCDDHGPGWMGFDEVEG